MDKSTRDQLMGMVDDMNKSLSKIEICPLRKYLKPSEAREQEMFDAGRISVLMPTILKLQKLLAPADQEGNTNTAI